MCSEGLELVFLQNSYKRLITPSHEHVFIDTRRERGGSITRRQRQVVPLDVSVVGDGMSQRRADYI
jgi:hypothetical protein